MHSKQLFNAEKGCDAESIGTFKISTAIASHMVLQKEKPIKVWGTADLSGIKFFIDFMGETASGIVYHSGDWLIELSPGPAARPSQTMRIYMGCGISVVLDSGFAEGDSDFAGATWEDHFVLLTYKYMGDGLRTAPGQEQLLGFQTEENDTLQDAKAEIIDKNTVKISFAGSPSAICYVLQQLAGTDIVNLMNSKLLPAPAIKTKRGCV